MGTTRKKRQKWTWTGLVVVAIWGGALYFGLCRDDVGTERAPLAVIASEAGDTISK